VKFIYNEILFSSKENGILSFAGKWLEPGNIILSEVSQIQETKDVIFSLMWNIDLIQIQAILSETVHAKGRSHMREGG
jgi:hypothetical protein